MTTTTWTTRSGEIVPIKDIHTSYIMYTIGMLEDAIETYNQQMLNATLQVYNKIGTNHFIVDTLKIPVLDALWEELDRRELPSREDKIETLTEALNDYINLVEYIDAEIQKLELVGGTYTHSDANAYLKGSLDTLHKLKAQIE